MYFFMKTTAINYFNFLIKQFTKEKKKAYISECFKFNSNNTVYNFLLNYLSAT